MKRLLVGVLVGMCLTPVSVLAYRASRPPEFHEWDSNAFSQLNTTLLQLYNLTNGRYALDVVTSTPKGNRKGNKGDMVFYNTGTNQLCVNVSGTITSWSCTNLTAL